jgi:hypothetical protein
VHASPEAALAVDLLGVAHVLDAFAARSPSETPAL